MGDYDFVKVVLERLAAEREPSTYAWMQVAIKPAEPLAFAAIGGVPAFGLPGNPVSSRVSFELFAWPALRRLAGHTRTVPEPVQAVAASAFRRRPDGRVHFDRVHVTYEGDRYVCERAGVQASNVLSGMAVAPVWPASKTATAWRRARPCRSCCCSGAAGRGLRAPPEGPQHRPRSPTRCRPRPGIISSLIVERRSGRSESESADQSYRAPWAAPQGAVPRCGEVHIWLR